MSPNTATRKLIIIIFLWFFLCPTLTIACDVDDFIYQEFGQRCREIGIMIRNLKVAQQMNLESESELKIKLLNEWVDFYLSHGKESPGEIASISNSVWQTTIKKAGNNIGLLAYKKIKPEAADKAIVPFELISQPTKFARVYDKMVSWKNALSRKLDTEHKSSKKWLENNIIKLNRMRFELDRENYPNEYKNITNKIRNILYNWQMANQSTGEALKTSIKFSILEIRHELKNEFNRIAELVFFERIN